MTNPTSNFGWQMPTSTDLVTDLPADFETFGQAVDTSLADLKGGTTGQVLSKASNTDMDFTWVAQDDSNAIQNAIVDAKGDLIAASAADTPARLAVGNNGETLVADSSTATGLRWQGSYPAGKNVLINGLLDIWQRSTSVTFGGAGGYNAQDRWYNFAGTSSTFARESSIVPTGCTYSCKVTVGASSAAIQSEQVIETLNAAPYAGATMTLSGYFQSSATPTVNYVVYYSTATDVGVGGAWTTITATSGGSGTAGSSSFTRISGVYAIPSTAKSLKVLFYTSSIASAGVLYWGGMQFEAGSVPTQVTRNGGTIQGELAACQRYYYRQTAGEAYSVFGNGIAASTTNARILVTLPVTMRVKAASLEFSNIGLYDGVTTAAITSAVVSEANFQTFNVNATVASGLTQYRPYQIIANNSTSAHIGVTAEL